MILRGIMSKKAALSSLALAAGLALGLGAPVHAQAADAPSPAYNVRIGYVSTERLFTDSKMAKAADSRIEGEFSKRQKALQEMAADVKKASDKLESESAGLTEAERTRRAREVLERDAEYRRKLNQFNEDLMQRKNEERANISRIAYEMIQQIAEQEKLDIILQEVAWYSPRIDITDKLISLLDKRTK